MRLWRYSLILATWLCFPMLDAVAADKPSRILFITQSAGFKHSVVDRKDQPLSTAEIALVQLGETTGLFKVDCTQDVVSDVTKENLKNYGIVAFYCTGDMKTGDFPLSQEMWEYFLNDWLKQPGHGVLGVHSAADNLRN